jgi:phage host-nuclease inhibitor protein Gam
MSNQTEYLKGRILEAQKRVNRFLGDSALKNEIQLILQEVHGRMETALNDAENDHEESYDAPVESYNAPVDSLANKVLDFIPSGKSASLADRILLEEFLTDYIPRIQGKTV